MSPQRSIDQNPFSLGVKSARIINQSIVGLLPLVLEVPRTISLGSKETTVEDKKHKLRKQVACTDSYAKSSCREESSQQLRKTQAHLVQRFARFPRWCMDCHGPSDTDRVTSPLLRTMCFTQTLGRQRQPGGLGLKPRLTEGVTFLESLLFTCTERQVGAGGYKAKLFPKLQSISFPIKHSQLSAAFR